MQTLGTQLANKFRVLHALPTLYLLHSFLQTNLTLYYSPSSTNLRLYTNGEAITEARVTRSCLLAFNLYVAHSFIHLASISFLFIFYLSRVDFGFSWWFSSKESTCNAGDKGSNPGSGRFPAEGNGNPFQYYCLGNPMDREAWWAPVRGVTSWTHLSMHTPVPNGNSLHCVPFSVQFSRSVVSDSL